MCIRDRPFTVRENARCQMFPDEWEFCGNVSSQYKQVGNAVPVSLAYEVAREIYNSLQLLEKNERTKKVILNHGDYALLQKITLKSMLQLL